jgi:uncharacterized protein YigE (DUF2233 family)
MHSKFRSAFYSIATALGLFLGGCGSTGSTDSAEKPTAVLLKEENAEVAVGQGSGSKNSASFQRLDSFVAIEASPGSVRLFWKDSGGRILGSLGVATRFAESQGDTLRFAMNAGMYTEDQGPLGLLIQEGRKLHALNRDTGYGNFYLRPNGVFFITRDGKAGICRTQDFSKQKAVREATQSGPMLLIDGKMHPAFKEGSQNVNIRNGVGILPDGRVLMAISTVPINLWDFAAFFRRCGCANALYLDGAISRAWFPEGGLRDTGGAFGVIVGVMNEQ